MCNPKKRKTKNSPKKRNGKRKERKRSKRKRMKKKTKKKKKKNDSPYKHPNFRSLVCVGGPVCYLFV